MTVVVGFDVGGAHLKVARVEDGRLTRAAQFACPLWKGMDRLDHALKAAADVTGGADVQAVTMTGELTEIFASRSEGVGRIASHLASSLPRAPRIFMGLKGFGTPQEAAADPTSVGSMNFLATAKVVAARKREALLIDMGSTTTDIVACDRPLGLTDAERLQTGELVYSGFTRTPVASVARRAPLAGQWQTLAADNFASMADVRRVLGELAEDADRHDTSDGQGKSVAESLVRLGRGFGRDGDVRHLDVWRVTAAYVCERQLRAIHDGAAQVLSRPGIRATSVVAAGIGAAAAAQLANRLRLPCLSFADLIEAPASLKTQAEAAAPAVAVALLCRS